MRLLGIVAVKEEAEAINCDEQIEVLVAGVGAVNAASCLTERLSKGSPPDCVLSLGVAGILPPYKLQIGDILIANRSVYFEEGIETPHGWRSLESIGFSLLPKDSSGSFKDNSFMPSALFFNRIKNIEIENRTVFVGGIATVSTISGCDKRSRDVAARTNCCAEGMEGAAVLHAAARFEIPALEIRFMSNTTGDRGCQIWDLKKALGVMGESIPLIIKNLANDI